MLAVDQVHADDRVCPETGGAVPAEVPNTASQQLPTSTASPIRQTWIGQHECRTIADVETNVPLPAKTFLKCAVGAGQTLLLQLFGGRPVLQRQFDRGLHRSQFLRQLARLMLPDGERSTGFDDFGKRQPGSWRFHAVQRGQSGKAELLAVTVRDLPGRPHIDSAAPVRRRRRAETSPARRWLAGSFRASRRHNRARSPCFPRPASSDDRHNSSIVARIRPVESVTRPTSSVSSASPFGL